MTIPTAQQLHQYFDDNLPDYFDLLRRMVEINSFTANPTGVNQLGELTTDIFADLGFTAERVASVKADFGDHFILTKPGSTERKVGLVSHLDTVFPPEEEARHNFTWQPAGERIYGPGTVDIKGGTVIIYMMLAALQQFAPTIYNETTWLVLLDASEERDGSDFGQLCRQRLGETAAACLVFEGGAFRESTFNLVTARKGMVNYRVMVEGKSAHAGNRHHQGANAIVQLAEIIQRIASWTDYNRQLTFNVGVVAGGTVTNRVPHHAEAQGEMRAFDMAIYEEGLAKLLALDGQTTVRSVEGDYACRVQVEIINTVAPWPRNPATDRLWQIWQATAQAIGYQAHPEARGGLSDGNHIWQQIPTLDGLGPAGDNMHCSERSDDGSKEPEYVQTNSFVPKAVLNTLALLKLLT